MMIPSVHRCQKVACYNQGNGGECWTAIHPDGRRSFEYATQDRAEEAASKPYDEVPQRHTVSWC